MAKENKEKKQKPQSTQEKLIDINITEGLPDLGGNILNATTPEELIKACGNIDSTLPRIHLCATYAEELTDIKETKNADPDFFEDMKTIIYFSYTKAIGYVTIDRKNFEKEQIRQENKIKEIKAAHPPPQEKKGYTGYTPGHPPDETPSNE